MLQHQRAIVALLAVLAYTSLGALFGITRNDAFERQWRVALGAIDEALLLGDTAGAAARWREAYGLAVRSGRWSQLVEVGDAALRIGDAPALQPSAAGAARQRGSGGSVKPSFCSETETSPSDAVGSSRRVLPQCDAVFPRLLRALSGTTVRRHHG